ncbi:hypothetical protein [Streptomyces phaeochromogenes]|uniref:hypothetical protein n=1 Tax=Streptomyces phaeochromogenes TaxID=1923 RepID=UPI0006E19459|nr:hypothetical protein [Streptomyces phaeochromogenes]
MSRHRHATGVTTPAPHHPSGPETVLIIVIVLTAAWLAPRGLEPTTILQLLGGAGLTGAGTVTALRWARRTSWAMTVA